MKTYKEWEESRVDLSKFVKPLDEIDETLYLYFGEALTPQYRTRDFTQIGEALKMVDGVFFYETVAQIEGKYYYLGVLPEFKQ